MVNQGRGHSARESVFASQLFKQLISSQLASIVEEPTLYSDLRNRERDNANRNFHVAMIKLNLTHTGRGGPKASRASRNSLAIFLPLTSGVQQREDVADSDADVMGVRPDFGCR